MQVIIDRIHLDRVWFIGVINIRAEMEFCAHSKSYLKITTWISQFVETNLCSQPQIHLRAST
jgi:hypothetical protein